ncbi:hypothetical protein ACEUZ9_000149 [Paracoccus litorisediminis]|uniref:hypothetical protein n=1 Tax=Paracoccus litorisediminis TaxID=2006130 RepID=UPI00372EF8D2
MAITKYEVKRRHFGDKDYFEGDTREADPSDVQHLLENGILAEVKAEPARKAKGK